MSNIPYRGFLSAALLISLAIGTSADAAAPFSPFVDLNGDSLGNFLLGTGADEGKIKAWYDSAHDGSAATQQDYGINTVANMPSLLTMQMPNGTTVNTVDFARNTTNNQISTAAASEWLYSKLGTEARITDFTVDTFNHGADSAYNASAVSWFTVVRTTLPNAPNDTTTNSAGRQSIFRVGLSETSVQWGTALQENYGGEGHTEQVGNVAQELGINARTAAPGNANTINNAGDVTDGWYVVGSTWNPTTGALYTRVIGEDGKNFTNLNSITVDGAIGPHALSSLGRLLTSSTTNLHSLQGQIAEQLVYGSALSPADTETVMQYLHAKYTQGLTQTWVSSASTDWGAAANWDVNSPPGSADDLVFSGAGSVGTADMTSAARVARSLTFNGVGGNFQITGLTLTNTLTLPGFKDTTTADITVTGGTSKIEGEGMLNLDDGSSPRGELRVDATETNHFIVDVASGASLDINASLSRTTTSTSASNTRGQMHKRGAGTLILSRANNLDFRPQGSGTQGGIFVDEGTLQLAAYGAKGNNFAPLTVASGAMLEFKNNVAMASPFDGQISGANGNRSVLTFSGTGVGGLGALYNSEGSNVLASGGNSSTTAGGAGLSSGLIVLANDTTFGVAAGSTLTLSHGITNFSFYETAGFGTAGRLTKSGDGTLIFDANNASDRNGYAQEIIVADGTFLVNSPTTATTKLGATLTGATSITMADPSGLYIGQPVTVTNISAGAPIFPTNAVIAGIGSGGVRISEAITDFTGAVVDLEFGAVTSALNTSPVTVNSGATFGGSGSILGSTVSVSSGAFLAPGASIGDFTVGSANLAGTLKIEFGSDDIDKLVVDQTLDVTGATFDFSALGSLSNGPEYVFATYGFLFGDANAIVVENLPGTLTLHHDTIGKRFYLTGSHSAGVDGDYNGDLVVNAADYALWRDNPNAFGNDPGGYNDWRANFGAGSGSGTGNGQAAVPEPTSVALAAIALLGLLGWQRGRVRA